jgi:hypothetical protein
MNSLRKLVGFLMVLLLAGFALPAAAQKAYQFTDFPPTIDAGGTLINQDVGLTNKSPETNSNFNSFTLTAPPGIEITAASLKPGQTYSATVTKNSGPGNTVTVKAIKPAVKKPATIFLRLNLKAQCSQVSNAWSAAVFSGGDLTGAPFNPSITASTTISATGCVTVTPSSAGNGTISPDTPQSFASGGTVVFTLTPSTHYHIADVPNTGTCTGGSLSGSVFTTGAVAISCTVIANFAIDTYTLSYTAGPGGTIDGDSPQTVGWNQSGSSVTAVPDSGYRFVRWNDGNTNATRSDPVTANVTYNAVFAGVLSFTQDPHDALAGGLIGPVKVSTGASTLNGTTVTLALSPAGPALSGNTATVTGGVATFNSVKTDPSTSGGTYQLMASITAEPDVLAALSATFKVTTSTGILTCPNDPDPPSGSVTGFDTGGGSVIPTKGDRLDNKDGSDCSAVPFKVAVTTSPTDHTVNVLWDELAQPYTVLKIETMWPPERAGTDLLPKPTLYSVGAGTYTSGLCLKKTPLSLAAYGTAGLDPDGPPEQIGTFTGTLDADATPGTPTASIAIAFNGKQPATYLTRSFSIIIPSSTVGVDPERMLVTGETSTGSGVFIVLRGTGKTVKSAHTGPLKVMWTPLPVDDGSATNAPAGAQVPVCIIEESSATVSTDLCTAWGGTGEPPPCLQPKSKLWAIGDLTVSRTP